MRVLAKGREGIDHAAEVAVVLVAVAAAAAGETDSGFEAFGRIGRKRDLREAACGDACAENQVGVNLRQALSEGHDGAQIVYACLAGFFETSKAGAAAAVSRILLAAGATVSLAHNDDGNVAAAREPLGLGKLVPWSDVRAFVRIAGSAVRQNDKRMPAGAVDIDFKRIEPVGEGLRRGDPHFFLHEAQ